MPPQTVFTLFEETITK